MFNHQCDGRQLIEILYDRRDHETELYSPPLFVRKRWWLLSRLTFVHFTPWLLICPETLYLCCCLRFRYVLFSLLSACPIPFIIVACPVRLHPWNWATNQRTRPVLPFLSFKGKKGYLFLYTAFSSHHAPSESGNEGLSPHRDMIGIARLRTASSQHLPFSTIVFQVLVPSACLQSIAFLHLILPDWCCRLMPMHLPYPTR